MSALAALLFWSPRRPKHCLSQSDFRSLWDMLILKAGTRSPKGAPCVGMTKILASGDAIFR
jgi:hypothetical protein